MRKALLALLASAVSAFGQAPDEVSRTVAKLGSPDYRTREAATENLRTLGAAALQPLQDSLAAGNPEANRRAELLIEQIRLRISDRAAVAPKTVSVKMFNAKLSDIFEELRKQTSYEFRVFGNQEPASKEMSFDTDGKVPVWEAVAKLCTATGLEFDSVISPQGVISFAPPTVDRPMAYTAQELSQLSEPERQAVYGNRTPTPEVGSILLRARGSKANPTGFSGAVRYEVVPVETHNIYAEDRYPVRVKFYPEPGMNWLSAGEIVATRAFDSNGRELKHDHIRPDPLVPTDDVPVRRIRRLRVVVPTAIPAVANPEATFALIPPQSGSPLTELARVEGLMHATAWSAPEELLSVRGFTLGGNAVTESRNGYSLSAKLVPDPNDKAWPMLEVDLIFDLARVKPTIVENQARAMARSDHGLTVTDAQGNHFFMHGEYIESSGALSNSAGMFSTQIRYTLRPVDAKTTGTPAKLSFHGTRVKIIAFPFTLKNVPLSPGTAIARDIVTPTTHPLLK